MILPLLRILRRRTLQWVEAMRKQSFYSWSTCTRSLLPVNWSRLDDSSARCHLHGHGQSEDHHQTIRSWLDSRWWTGTTDLLCTDHWRSETAISSQCRIRARSLKVGSSSVFLAENAHGLSSRHDPPPIQILVPGAGLGRLSWELARLGYACQGNEVSMYMLIASHFVLNK